MYTRTYIRARTLRRRKRAGLSRALTGWSGRRGRRERTRVHLSARACSARYDVNALDNIGVGHDTSLAHSLDRKNCSCFSYLSYLRPHVRARVLVCRRYSDEKNIRGQRFGLSFFPFSREREREGDGWRELWRFFCGKVIIGRKFCGGVERKREDVVVLFWMKGDVVKSRERERVRKEDRYDARER